MVVCRVLAVIFILFSFSVFAQEDSATEIQSLIKIFQEKVSTTIHDQNYLNWSTSDALARILQAENSYKSQYFVYVDRNPEKQNIMVGFFESMESKITIIGWDKVSTGDPNRKGHFITPIGSFTNSIDNRGYRAMGTKNSKGWRGLGGKGSRVWDFGWQKTSHKNEEREIRLLLHATDPDFGEKRLGSVDSKGCVRITAKLNQFLDHYGILDDEYEQEVATGTSSWLLLKDRETVNNPGKIMIVGDSLGIIFENNPVP